MDEYKDCFSCKHALDINEEVKFECEITGNIVDEDECCENFERGNL